MQETKFICKGECFGTVWLAGFPLDPKAFSGLAGALFCTCYNDSPPIGAGQYLIWETAVGFRRWEGRLR